MVNFFRSFALLVLQLSVVAIVVIGVHRLLIKVLPGMEDVNFSSSISEVEVVYERADNFTLELANIFPRKFKVETAEGTEFLPIDNITCLRKYDKDVLVYLIDEGKAVELPNTSLSGLGGRLENADVNYFFTLKRDIVNMAYIRKVIRENKGSSSSSNYVYTIILDDNNEVPLPKAQKDKLLSRLGELAL